MHGIHTLSRTALASIPNLSAIGTIRSGRLKTLLRKQFGKTGRNINMLRISLTNYSCNFEDTMFPQCQCRRPSHSPHACGLEAALSSIRNKKTILLLRCFLKFHYFYSLMVHMLQQKLIRGWTWVETQRVWANWVFPDLQDKQMTYISNRKANWTHKYKELKRYSKGQHYHCQYDTIPIK